MKAIFQCHATDDSIESPEFFAVNLSEELIQRIESHSKLCVDDICQIVSHFDDGIWETECFENEFRLRDGGLVVGPEYFWFNIYPKHGHGHLETQMQTVQKLREAFDSGRDLVFFGDFEDELKEAYEDTLEEV